MYRSAFLKGSHVLLCLAEADWNENSTDADAANLNSNINAPQRLNVKKALVLDNLLHVVSRSGKCSVFLNGRDVY